MNKYRVSFIIGVFACLLFSCDQYAIFDAIAQEVKPKPALIKGTPSKIVKDSSGNLYVANGELWKFAGGQWNKISAPSSVRDVAAVGADVYVISVGSSPSLSKLGGGTIGVPGTVQGIYGASSTLFVTVGVGASYSVYSYDGSNFSNKVVASGQLRGAVYDGSSNYYLATSDGLYHSSSPNSSFTSVQSGNFLGAIALSNSVVAVTASAVYEASGGNTPTSKASGDSLTGAIAVSGTTLYLGRTRGYRTLDTSTWQLTSPSMATYNSTIAQVRVLSMHAVSADVIFASVLSSEPKRSGLMSLRDGSWNMEE
jgi:hypothetical protein